MWRFRAQHYEFNEMVALAERTRMELEVARGRVARFLYAPPGVRRGRCDVALLLQR